MAVTQNTYTGNGSTVLYSFSFPYLESTDIKVSLNGTITTAYTLANATTIQFNTAPANGVAIRIYRETENENTKAMFYPGAAIRAQDLNDNFDQVLFVTQESTNTATAATSTANTALTNSATAISTANTAVSTANTASTNASAAVTTANTANSNASAAVTTANTANTNSTAAVNTANAASTTANTAASTAAGAVTTANGAVTTANTANSTANTALATANTAATNASTAISTANTASTNATTAVNTANSAVTTANAASATANTASNNASAALNAVAGSLQYTLVANVAAIPASPVNNLAIEIANSTGIESFSPVANRPAGFVGDSGLSVRLQYTTTGSTWNWLNYFANDAENRYLKLSGGALTGQLKADDSTSVASPVIAFDGDTNTGIAHTGADELALVTGGTARVTVDPSGSVAVTNSLSVGGQTVVVTNDSRLSDTRTPTDGTVTNAKVAVGAAIDPAKISGTAVVNNDARLTDTRTPTDGSVTNAKVSAAAAIAGTKISPDFGSQNVTTTGTVTGASLNPTSSTVPTNGVYLPAANSVGISTNGTGRLFVNSSGSVGIGTSNPSNLLDCYGSSLNIAQFKRNTTGVAGGGIAFGNDTRTYSWLGDSAVASLYDNVAGAQRLVVDTSGRVGIGTTSPSGNLHSNAAYTNTSDLQVIADGNIAGFNARSSAGGRFSLATGYIGANITSLLTSTSTSNPSSEVMRFTHSTGEIDFFVGGSGAAKIDASRRLLVGTSSARTNVAGSEPSAGYKVQIESSGTNGIGSLSLINNYSAGYPGSLAIGKTNGSSVGSNTVVSNGDDIGIINFVGADGTNLIRAATITAFVDGTPGANDMPGRLVFSTTADGASSPTERMRIRQDGSILINATSTVGTNPYLGVSAGANEGIVVANTTGATRYPLSFLQGTTYVGSISTTGSSTAYNTSSDYRLKENIVDITDGIIRLQQLKPSRFNFIADPDTTVDGFIAHEVQAVVPEAITGEKDAVDDDGNPIYQGIDQSKLVPLLTAALQEAIGEIESLKARVAALESA